MKKKLILFVISLFLSIFGIINNGQNFIKNNASMICLDCIGLGK